MLTDAAGADYGDFKRRVVQNNPPPMNPSTNPSKIEILTTGANAFFRRPAGVRTGLSRRLIGDDKTDSYRGLSLRDPVPEEARTAHLQDGLSFWGH